VIIPSRFLSYGAINKKQWRNFYVRKKLLKSEKIRIKNDKFASKRERSFKRVFPFVNTGMVGINKANIGIKDKDSSNYMDKNPSNLNLKNIHKKDNK